MSGPIKATEAWLQSVQPRLSMGQKLTYGFILEEKQVSLPSYGTEMRGGTSNFKAIISECKIGSPVITSGATVVVVMNDPSLDKYKNSVKPNGCIIVNSPILSRKGAMFYYINADAHLHVVLYPLNHGKRNDKGFAQWV